MFQYLRVRANHHQRIYSWQNRLDIINLQRVHGLKEEVIMTLYLYKQLNYINPITLQRVHLVLRLHIIQVNLFIVLLHLHPSPVSDLRRTMKFLISHTLADYLQVFNRVVISVIVLKVKLALVCYIYLVTLTWHYT